MEGLFSTGLPSLVSVKGTFVTSSRHTKKDLRYSTEKKERKIFLLQNKNHNIRQEIRIQNHSLDETVKIAVA